MHALYAPGWGLMQSSLVAAQNLCSAVPNIVPHEVTLAFGTAF